MPGIKTRPCEVLLRAAFFCLIYIRQKEFHLKSFVQELALMADE